jgi:tetratricopeptide (TPR) repeat protein
MSSNLDVYALCPCGSGKKVKFCCNKVLADLDKVARLHENNQAAKALQKLESLAVEHPDAQIIPITRSQLLMEEHRFDEAATIMRQFLDVNPSHGHATSLLAFARYMDVGFHQAKAEIHRAFQVCRTSSPDVIASLASQIAEEVIYDSSMAGREHYALALRLTQDDDERQQLFEQLMKIDGSADIPCPMRGSHQLDKIEGTEETEKNLKSAARLATLGCWEIAAKLFSKVAETDEKNWALWRNIGLCRAWDADYSAGSDALHTAAELADDFDKAVECEVLAQLLELPQIEDHIEIVSVRYDMSSTGKVLSILDDHPRVHRLQNSNENSEQLVAQYLIMDIDIPDDDADITDDNIPRVTAELSAFEWQDHGKLKSMLAVMLPANDEKTAIVETVESILGEDITPAVPENHDHDHDHDGKCVDDDAAESVEFEPGANEFVVRRVLKELYPSQERKFYGRRLQIVARREVAKQDAIAFVDQWCNIPLVRLEAKTPNEVCNDEDFKVRVAAAVLVLESISDVTALHVDISELRTKLNVTPPKPIEVDESTALNSLTVMELHRLPLSELNDDQLSAIVNRALLIRHAPFVYAVLSELASRDVDNLKGLDSLSFYRTIAESCQSMGKREEALKWVTQARKSIQDSDDFEEKLNWAMREFQLRVEDTSDPGLPAIVDEVWNYFGRKLPTIRQAVEPVLTELKIPIPDKESGILLPGDAPETAGAGEKKLWIPD